MNDIKATHQRPRRSSPSEISLLLTTMNDAESLQTLLRFVYSELHNIARHFCRSEPPWRTLQPTALLNEALIRLIEDQATFKNRRHFFASAARTMRRILVDSARRRSARKRSAVQPSAQIREIEFFGFENPLELLDLHRALARMQAVSPLWSEIVDLRIFAGFSNSEAALILSIGESTARRHWTQACAWLKTDLQGHGI